MGRLSSVQDDLLHLRPRCNTSDRTASGSRQWDLGMFVDIMGAFIISEYLMDSVCWQRQTAGEIFSFLKRSITSSAAKGRSGLYKHVPINKYTVSTSDKSYQNKIPLCASFFHHNESIGPDCCMKSHQLSHTSGVQGVGKTPLFCSEV